VDTVAVGGTVTWVNNGPSPHTSTSAAGGWDSGIVADGGSFPHVFPSAGSFGYICSLHPQMTGTIVVR
jgi:plastocyanin